jgi:hypothetical protein
MTAVDFLGWAGDGTGRRYQLVDGVVRAIPIGPLTRGTIQASLSWLLGDHFKAAGGPYRALTRPCIAPRVRASINVPCPALGVTAVADEPDMDIVPDPILLIEILSPGNASDTWDNVWSYTTIPSVREIVVVHSTRIMAEVLRAGGQLAARARGGGGRRRAAAGEHRLRLPDGGHLRPDASRRGVTPPCGSGKQSAACTLPLRRGATTFGSSAQSTGAGRVAAGLHVPWAIQAPPVAPDTIASCGCSKLACRVPVSRHRPRPRRVMTCTKSGDVLVRPRARASCSVERATVPEPLNSPSIDRT